MADQETLDAVRQMLEQKLAPIGMAQQPAAFHTAGQPLMPGAVIAPTGISFRMKIPLPDGRDASAYIHFGAEHCTSPQAIQMFAAQIAQTFPIDAWMPKQQNWGNQGGGSGGGGGGWNNNNRGGYGGGGFRRNW